jgi:RNA polymerase sigma-70 factor (ECF subfamily)
MSRMKPKGAQRAASLVDVAIQHYGPQLHRFLLRRLQHTQDAEDLAQEVFMRLSRIANTDFVRKPRAYLFGIASHVVSEFWIRNEHAKEWLTFDSDAVEYSAEYPAQVQPDELVDRLDIQRQLARALESLPPAQLAVFLMHKRDGWSYEEIAAKLGCSERKVESYISDAKVRLRRAVWDR